MIKSNNIYSNLYNKKLNFGEDINLSVGFIIISDDNKEIFLLKEKRSNKWGPPKGHNKIGETKFQTAVREVKEEINVDIDCNKKYGSITAGKVKLFYTKMSKDKISLDVNSEDDEISEKKWFKIDDLLMSNLDPSIYNSPIRYLIKNSKLLYITLNENISYKKYY